VELSWGGVPPGPSTMGNAGVFAPVDEPLIVTKTRRALTYRAINGDLVGRSPAPKRLALLDSRDRLTRSLSGAAARGRSAVTRPTRSSRDSGSNE
jgi:hypothetical protein